MEQGEEDFIQRQFSDLIGKQKKEFETQMQQQLEEFEKYRQNALIKQQKNNRIDSLKGDFVQKSASDGNFNRDQQQFKKISNIIKINVGGKRFTTTLTTLTSKKDSMLAAMFSGRFDIEKDEDGFFFIDRNGKYFTYLLDYLRTGEFSTSLTEETLAEVKKEACYYQIFTPDPEPEKFTSDCANLNYHGIYYDGDSAYSFVTEDQVAIFSNGLSKKPESYSVDSFNFVHFNQMQLFIDHNRLKKNAITFEYMAPSLPDTYTPYVCAQSSNRVTFQKDQITLENYAYPPVDKYTVKITRQTSNYGVPIVVTETPIDGFSWDNNCSKMCPIFYCYGKIVIGRAGASVRLFIRQ